MCGRFFLIMDLNEILDRFCIESSDMALAPRYNIAPSQDVAVVVKDVRGRKLHRFKWGLIPFWFRQPKGGRPIINARAETVAAKPAFKSSFRHRRCLIPANGYFEWQQDKQPKIPYRISLRNMEPFAMAGLWDTWQSAEGTVMHTFVIITTKAPGNMAQIHERMPLMLAPENEETWLDTSSYDTGSLNRLLTSPFTPELLEIKPVSTLVNSPRNDFRSVLEPL